MNKKFLWTFLTAFILMGQSNVLFSMDNDDDEDIASSATRTQQEIEDEIASNTQWTHADIEDENGYETGWAYNGYEEGETNPPGN